METFGELCENRTALAKLETWPVSPTHQTYREREAKRYVKWLANNLEISTISCQACQGEASECAITTAIAYMDKDDKAYLKDKGFKVLGDDFQ